MPPRSPLRSSSAPASPGQPLLPLASAPPTSPGAGRALHQHPRRRAARRTLLLGLLAFCLLNAAWGTRALLRAWQGHSGAWQGLATSGDGQRLPGTQAAAAVDSAAAAALDAGVALRDAAGVAKHTAVAAGQAAGAAVSLFAPVAAQAASAVGTAAKGAASAAGSLASKLAAESAEAAEGTVKNATAAAAAQASNSTTAAEEPEEREGGPRPPAELPPPDVAPASNDSCAQALGIPKVALLFLSMGPLPHEPAWRLWFASAAGLLPIHATKDAVCGRNRKEHRALLKACAAQQPVVATATAAAAFDAISGRLVRRASDQPSAGLGAAAAGLGPASQQAAQAIDQQRLYSVYIHAPPAFEGYAPGSLWRGRLIPRRTAAGWGDISLVEATRSLLSEAFRDPLNQRFVLLSESDVPLYDPLTLHQQLLAEGKSRVNACPHKVSSEWRWSKEMKTPHMNFTHWRKSSQWIGLTREHAAAVLADTEVYRSFERHCWSGWSKRRNFWRDCFPDEHYFPTLLAVLGREAQAECGGWGVAAQDWSKGGPHPKAFLPEEVNATLLLQMRDSAHCDGAAAYAGAQRQYLDAAQALTADHLGCCLRLGERAARLAPFPAMPGSCPLTARKFPANTTAPVLHLFNSSCAAPQASTSGQADSGGGSGAPPQLRLLTEHYCQQRAAAAAEDEAA